MAEVGHPTTKEMALIREAVVRRSQKEAETVPGEVVKIVEFKMKEGIPPPIDILRPGGGRLTVKLFGFQAAILGNLLEGDSDANRVRLFDWKEQGEPLPKGFILDGPFREGEVPETISPGGLKRWINNLLEPIFSPIGQILAVKVDPNGEVQFQGYFGPSGEEQWHSVEAVVKAVRESQAKSLKGATKPLSLLPNKK